MRQLVGFAKVNLKLGEARTVRVRVPMSRLAVVPGDVLGDAEAVVIPREYTLTVGSDEARVGVP